MKTGCYSVIPAEVRYDKRLSAQDILLYAEIAASSDTEGVCNLTNEELGNNINVDPRSISRYMKRLLECGHIDAVLRGKYRTIKLPIHGVNNSNYVKEEIRDTNVDFCEELLSLWEKEMGVKIDKKELYYQKIKQRLITFEKEQLTEALVNRAIFVKDSAWHQEPENKVHATNIDILLRNDESVLKWLNTKLKQKDTTTVTPFKFN